MADRYRSRFGAPKEQPPRKLSGKGTASRIEALWKAGGVPPHRRGNLAAMRASQALRFPDRGGVTVEMLRCGALLSLVGDML